MAYVAAVMEPRWKDLSNEHSERRARAESAIKLYSEGKSPQPLAVVGGFRTGKTELLYHCFRYGWSLGTPALYITLKGQASQSKGQTGLRLLERHPQEHSVRAIEPY